MLKNLQKIWLCLFEKHIPHSPFHRDLVRETALKIDINSLIKSFEMKDIVIPEKGQYFTMRVKIWKDSMPSDGRYSYDVSHFLEAPNPHSENSTTRTESRHSSTMHCRSEQACLEQCVNTFGRALEEAIRWHREYSESWLVPNPHYIIRNH